MHQKNWTRRAAVAATLGLLAAASATAQQRVIRIIVPFGPGAVQDTIARTFNNELGQALGASVIVENRAGAGGTIGTALVAKAPPDGNTLVLAAASHTLAGHLYAKLPYDPIKDFVGVSYLGNSGYAIAAPGNLGVNNLAEYVKLIKSKPGQLNYASAGSGSATHLGMAYFLAKAGGDMQHIPMKSTGDAVNEVLAGRVQGVTSSLIGIMALRPTRASRSWPTLARSDPSSCPSCPPWPRRACQATSSIRGSACWRPPARPRPRWTASTPPSSR